MIYVGDDLIIKQQQVLRAGYGHGHVFHSFIFLLLTFHYPLLTVGIKKKSKVPGVMITQFIETLPEGKSHPDFTRKPIALTIQEGRTDSIRIISTLISQNIPRWNFHDSA